MKLTSRNIIRISNNFVNHLTYKIYTRFFNFLFCTYIFIFFNILLKFLREMITKITILLFIIDSTVSILFSGNGGGGCACNLQPSCPPPPLCPAPKPCLCLARSGGKINTVKRIVDPLDVVSIFLCSNYF